MGDLLQCGGIERRTKDRSRSATEPDSRFTDYKVRGLDYGESPKEMGTKAMRTAMKFDCKALLRDSMDAVVRQVEEMVSVQSP